jgi:hypothetical protein
MRTRFASVSDPDPSLIGPPDPDAIPVPDPSCSIKNLMKRKGKIK